jgi:hypothetical protein
MSLFDRIKIQIIAIDEMNESERVAWMRSAMTLLCRLLKDEAAAPNARDHRAPEGRSGASTC